MHPTLEHGQLLLTRPRAGRLRVGDIVVFTTGAGVRYLKRIAAGPGDLVELEAGCLFVNKQPYGGRPRTAGACVEAWRVPDAHVFVVGDNLPQSEDSRVWPDPFVPVARISGVARRQAPRCAVPRRLPTGFFEARVRGHRVTAADRTATAIGSSSQFDCC